MTWAQRLKRVFNIDIETCSKCGGAVRVVPTALTALVGQALACIEDPVVIAGVRLYVRYVASHIDQSNILLSGGVCINREQGNDQ